MEQTRSSNDDVDPTAILVLVTGLPASGKSSFLGAAQRYIATLEDKSFSLFGDKRRGCIAAVLQLDHLLMDLHLPQHPSDFPEHEADNSLASSTQLVLFSPERWKWATEQLLRLTEQALRACASEAARVRNSAQTGKAAIPLIFVEDNMHLRSMRDRYYRLCRKVEEEEQNMAQQSTEDLRSASRTFFALLELRFTAPLSVCLERNAQRRHSLRCDRDGEQVAAKALDVPASVIVSMDAVFDRCYDAATTPKAQEQRTMLGCSDVNSPLWRWTSSTQPWSLLTLACSQHLAECAAASEENGGHERAPQRLPTAEALVAEFFTAVLQSAARHACHAQYAQLIARRERRQREADTADNSAMSRTQQDQARVQAHAHQLDLQLRALAHTFLTEQRSAIAQTANSTLSAVEFGKRASKLKKEALQRFKEERAEQRSHQVSQEEEEEKMAAMHEACFLKFHQSLVSLVSGQVMEKKKKR